MTVLFISFGHGGQVKVGSKKEGRLSPFPRRELGKANCLGISLSLMNEKFRWNQLQLIVFEGAKVLKTFSVFLNEVSQWLAVSNNYNFHDHFKLLGQYWKGLLKTVYERLALASHLLSQWLIIHQLSWDIESLYIKAIRWRRRYLNKFSIFSLTRTLRSLRN